MNEEKFNELVKKSYKKFKPEKIIIDNKNKEIKIQISKITTKIIKQRMTIDDKFLKLGYSVLFANKIK